MVLFAVERATEIVAECPLGGICGYRQSGRAVLWLFCGYYRGREKCRRGLKILCDYKEEHERKDRGKNSKGL